MALLGLVMADLLLLCLIVIGFLLSRCWPGPQSHALRDSLQVTNDGFQTEGESKGRWAGMFPRGKVLPLGKRSSKSCSTCGSFSNHVQHIL
uniref:ATP synthase F0 subunit 8 n=1 Tax=Knipowitschia caucasica TaxID=637954 RepID=A0AAV2L1H8_KNICA